VDDNHSSEKFDFNYVAPDAEEKRWIEDIRRQYLQGSERDEKVAQVKALHKRARLFPKCFASAMGVCGTLILGVGMTLTLVWNYMVAGIIVGLIGMAIMFLTYPVYQFLIEKGKKKYGDRILRLTDEISGSNTENVGAEPDVTDDGFDKSL